MQKSFLLKLINLHVRLDKDFDLGEQEVQILIMLKNDFCIQSSFEIETIILAISTNNCKSLAAIYNDNNMFKANAQNSGMTF